MKQEVNTLSDQVSCLGKGDKEFSKPFYLRITRFRPIPPPQIEPTQTQDAQLNLNVR